jgi:2-polyprenyl-6-methoxyphenol hydroxylase-like FAD-dependent oxidoreductase
LAIVQWSIPILKKLLPIGLFDRLAEVQCDPTLEIGPDETVEFWNSQTGEVLKVIPTPNMKQVSRKKLRSLCAEGVEVLWGKRLDHVTYDLDGRGLKAHFADGSTYRGEMLVGADGPTSKVREILLGAERSRRAPPVDIVYNMAIVKYGDAMKAKHVRPGNGQVLFGYNPKGIFSMIASKCLDIEAHTTGRSLTGF